MRLGVFLVDALAMYDLSRIKPKDRTMIIGQNTKWDVSNGSLHGDKAVHEHFDIEEIWGQIVRGIKQETSYIRLLATSWNGIHICFEGMVMNCVDIAGS